MIPLKSKLNASRTVTTEQKVGDWPEVEHVSRAKIIADTFASQCRRYRLPPYVTEHPFAKDALSRMWRFDFAWPQFMMYVEIEGLVPKRLKVLEYDDKGNPKTKNMMVVLGRHTSIDGIIEDMVKYNAATRLGWRGLRVPQKWILNGSKESTTAINETMLALEAIQNGFPTTRR